MHNHKRWYPQDLVNLNNQISVRVGRKLKVEGRCQVRRDHPETKIMVASSEMPGAFLRCSERHQEVRPKAVPCRVTLLHVPTWWEEGVPVSADKGGSNKSLPDGMSTEQSGMVIAVRVEMRVSKGGRTSPWKLNPKTASTATL